MSQRISQLAAASLVGTEQMIVSKPSATVTITGTTISAAAADNSFNDSANGFVAAGFAVGDAVRIQGFTGDTANNIFSAVVTAVTIGKLTIGGTDGNVIVDDAAGESVTITKWESARASAQDVADLAAAGGSTQGKHDVPIEAISFRSRTTNGGTGLQWLDMGAGKPEVGYVSFDPTTQQFFVFGLKMPKSWNEATITYTVDWMHPATTTNFDVEFGLSAAAFGDGDSLNVSYGTAQVVNDTGGATDTVYTTPESSAITIANTPATRDGIQLQLSRNPSGTDNLAVNARVLRVTIYIVTDADTDA
jgi:hypothetical protein